MPRHWAVAGIDLAWGERRPDGICLLQGEAKRVVGLSHALTHGDDALLDYLQTHLVPGVKLCSASTHRWFARTGAERDRSTV